MSVFVKAQVDYGKDSSEWLLVLSSIQDRVTRNVAHFSEAYGISPFDLKLRVLLHLPRFRFDELENDDLLNDEVNRLALRTQELQRRFREWASQEPLSNLEKDRVNVCEVPEEVAAVIHERFHYIGSGRSGRHFALYFVGRPVLAALVTLSEMDVQKMKAHLPNPRETRCLLLSRMFSFRWAPRNTASYLLGKVGQLLKKERQVESLVTWVNPNLGFRAASYRAANWTFIGSEPTVYRYLGGDYLTARQLFQKAQTCSLRPDASKLGLAPLQVWYYRIN
jgi:hypothetical protein